MYTWDMIEAIPAAVRFFLGAPFPRAFALLDKQISIS